MTSPLHGEGGGFDSHFQYMAAWSRGMILPLGGRGRGFDSRSGPMHHWCSGNIRPFQGRAPVSITGWCILFWESSSNGRALALHARGNGIDAHVFQVYSFNLILPTFHKRNDKNVYTFIFSLLSSVGRAQDL